MQLKIALHCCPIENMNPRKETTLLLGAEASVRYKDVYIYTTKDLFLENGKAYAWARKVKIDKGDENNINFLSDNIKLSLDELDIILLRPNPPVNQDYLTATYILDHVDASVLIINSQQAIRNFNGKIFANDFPNYITPYAMGNNINTLIEFYEEHHDIILKPMNGFGGHGIHRITENCNPTDIFNKFRQDNKGTFIVQKYIPEAVKGDKRIILFDGEPVAALLRVPESLDKPANITLGASVEETDITEREHALCQEMKPILQERNLFFVGIDMLGDYLVEINLISPGTIRPANELYGIELEKIFWDKVERKFANRQLKKAI